MPRSFTGSECQKQKRETHDLEIAKMLITAMKAVKGGWLPAVQNGIPVSSKIYLLHDLGLSEGGTSASAGPKFI